MPEHSASNASRQAQALARAERIVEAARDLLADPDNNVEIRRRYMQRVFNLDRAAEAWVALAGRSFQEGDGEPAATKARRDPMLDRSEEEWEALEEAAMQVYGLRVGQVLTETDVAALNLVDRCHREDDESATDAYHRGLEDGLRKRGGDELVNLEKRMTDAMVARATEKVMRRLAEQRAGVAEFLLGLALAALTTPPDPQEAWEWLAGQTNLSLDFQYDDPEVEGVWSVCGVTGPVNDREWERVAFARTPLDAVLLARAALAGEKG